MQKMQFMSKIWSKNIPSEKALHTFLRIRPHGVSQFWEKKMINKSLRKVKTFIFEKHLRKKKKNSQKEEIG